MPASPIHRWRLAALVLASLCLPALAAAAAPGLTLREALQAALAHNPDLALFEFDLRENDALGTQAALQPPLQAGASMENFAGTGEAGGWRGSETTLSISRVIELGGKRAARIAAVDAARDDLRVARQAAQLDVVAEVTRRFIAVVEAQEKVALAEQATTLADDTVQAAELRVQAARAPHVELDRAAVAAQRTQLRLQGARTRLDTARRSLAAMWGEQGARVDGRPMGPVMGSLYQLPQVGDYTALVAALARNPDFLRFASEERLQDAALRLAATQRRTDLEVGAGIRRLQAGRDQALVASVSIPLFAGRRAGGAIAQAAARRDAVGARREAALVKARAQLFALHRQLQDAIEVAQALGEVLVPRLAEALHETEYAFERGRYGYLELVDAQHEYLAAQGERIEAAVLAQLLAAEIERLTNAPLAPQQD